MKRFENSNIDFVGITRPEAIQKHPTWFTDTAIFNTFELTSKNPPVKELLSIAAEPHIYSAAFVKTPESVSYGGQMLEGNNLILEISFKVNIKYAADTPEQNLHMAFFESVPQNICIVLPTHHVQPTSEKYYQIPQLYQEKKLVAKPYILDIYGNILENKKVYVSMALFVDVVLKKLS